MVIAIVVSAVLSTSRYLSAVLGMESCSMMQQQTYECAVPMLVQARHPLYAGFLCLLHTAATVIAPWARCTMPNYHYDTVAFCALPHQPVLFLGHVT
jgi:hypothetical protein